jgi:hypothetical protein
MPNFHCVFNLFAKFGPALSATATFIGVIAALFIAARQRALQLKLSLFDKRFVVYREVEEFICRIVRNNGSWEPDDELRFLDAKERAHFLFPEKSRVVPYLDTLYDKARQLRSLKRDHEAQMGVVHENREIFDLLSYFSVPAQRERIKVFSPHLYVPD